MKKIILYIITLTLCFYSCKQEQKEPVDYVNTHIGNISILLVPTFPTTHLPNSMVRMIPARAEFTSDRIAGFPLNVPAHRRGEVLYLMPYCGDELGIDVRMNYRYDQEVSEPYEYSVFLDDHEILMRFAPAARGAVFTLDFEKGGGRYVMLRTNGNGELQINGNVIRGYEDFHGTKHYVYLEFEQNPIDVNSCDSNNIKSCFAHFDDNVNQVRLRYGVSYISEEQARKNMENEILDFDVDKLAQKARTKWNQVLGKIAVEGATEDQKTVFYTSLYRVYERMINISEDGKYYSAFDHKVHEDEGIPFWTDDWTWDTFLAHHPLHTILDPKAQGEKVTSYIRMCEQSPEKWMPTFPYTAGDDHAMNGNHAAVIFADALCKNIEFDVEKAFQGMKNTILTESIIPWYRGPKTELDTFYDQNGWFPGLYPGEEETVPQVNSFEKRQCVAVTLGASYDDWSIAQLAKYLNKTEDYDFFMKRAFNYRNLFNKETLFFHPKDEKGNFIKPFDYLFSGGIGCRDYYDEGNAWMYFGYVHHNIADLIDLCGGNQAFANKLDEMYVADLTRAKWQFYCAHPDATGNVGQFVMGNEPNFHVPYLYNYVGQPWKTQKRIRMLLESWFRNDLMGIPGDEDGGGMTAFVVFSQLGFYPVSPGMPIYTIGSPIFTKSCIELDNGKQFIIEAKDTSWDNKYIQSATLNGKLLNRSWFTHEELINGGTLTLQMGNRPNKEWGIETPPPSANNYK